MNRHGLTRLPLLLAGLVPVSLWAQPTQGLLGYWNFDQGSGTLASDASGNGYNGTVSAGSWTAGKVNSALRFAGAGGVFTPPIPFQNTFSISAWVNALGSNQSGFIRIAETRYDSGFFLGTDGTGTRYKFIVNNGAGATGTCGLTFGCAEGGPVTSGWHLITATYDGTTARLYVDTAQVATETFTSPAAAHLPLYIARNFSAASSGWNGSIDEARLYNRALTSAEVLSIYGSGGSSDTLAPSTPTNVSALAVSGARINLSWTASTDNIGVTGYRVHRNGALVGSPTSTSYSDTGLTASTTYSYTVAAVDAAGNASALSSAVSATTLALDTIPPTVSITAPAAGATVSGAVSISATASDNVAIASVQFQLDGVNLGSPDTTAPYSISWETIATANGGHTLTAIARDTSNNAATSAPINLTVNNVVAPLPTQGLIGYWSFDQTSGTMAYDSSGNGYHGAVTGATWTTGKIHSALRFTGTGTGVGTPGIPLPSAFSISAWVNPAVFTQVAYVRIAETQYNGGFFLGANGVGTKYKFIINTGAGATGSCGLAFGCAEGGTITAGWHLVTGTYDGATARLYVDGIEVARETFASPGATNYPLYIGRYYSSNNSGWNGNIDETRLYNRALTAAEVSGIYNYIGGPPDTVAPSTPTNVSAVAVSHAHVNLSWNASADQGSIVAGYRVYRNGTLVGSPSSRSYTDTGLAPATTYTYTVAAFDAVGNTSNPSAPVVVTTLILDTAAPVVSVTAPAPATTVSGTITIAATATDNVAVTNLQFRLNGNAYGPLLTSPPYSVPLDTTALGNGQHIFTAVARDAVSNTGTSAPVTVTVNNAASSAPTQGLIGYWTFDQGSGALAYDGSGNGYHGTVTGATWSPGKIYSSLLFNGNTSGVVTPGIPLQNAFSVSAWVNTSVAVQGAYVRIVETQYNGGLFLGTNGTGSKYKFIVNNGAGATGQCNGLTFGCAEGGTVTAGWHLITATYDGATARLYVDTAQVASETFTAPPATNYPVYIGRYYGGAGSGWNGLIDEARLYNRALTAAEVLGLYNYLGGPPDTVAPSIPVNVSAVAISSAQVNLSWNASSDNVAVAGYQVYRNGAPVGSTSSLSYSDTGLAPTTTYTYRVAAFDAAGNNSALSSPVNATTLILDTTAPTVSITTPASGATVSGTIGAAATASDNLALANVQFLLNGNTVGPLFTSGPYSITLNTANLSNGAHTLTVVARDTSHNVGTSAPVHLTVSNAAPSAPVQGLIGYWNFDQNSGTVAYDGSGNGYHGAISGAAWVPGKINSGLRFNSPGHGISTPVIPLQTTFSISAWVNPALVPQGSYVRIAETQYSSGLFLGTNSTGSKYKFIVNGGNGATGSCALTFGCAEGGAVSAGWHLITGTYDGVTAKLYVDTTEVGRDTLTPPLATNYPLVIGRAYSGSGEWNGLIDEARLYNRALTAAEVSGLYSYLGGPPDTIAPSVPTNVSAVPVSSAQINLSWAAAADNVGVAGYRVYRNGTLIASTSSRSYSDVGLTPTTTYTYTVAALDTTGNLSSQSGPVNATTLAVDTAPPSVSITTPATGAMVSGTITLSAAAGDNVGIASVQFQLNGNAFGTPVTTPPYSRTLDTTILGNGTHSLTAIARDTSNNATTSSPVALTVSNAASSASSLGLIGYWNFDQNSGAVAYDGSGSGYHSAVSGATWVTGKINSGLRFNSAGTGVVTPGIPLQSTFSISAWVNPAVTPQGSYTRIAETQYSSGLYLGTDALGRTYKFVVNNGTGAGSSCALPLGCVEGGLIQSGWHLVTGTYDGLTAKLYVDAVQVSQGTFSSPVSIVLPLFIGRQQSASSSGWNGVIDEVRLYNRALTAAEVAGIYNYLGAPPDIIAPSTPGNVSALAVSSSQINISWGASTDNGAVAGYRVYRNGTLVASTSTRSFSDTGLSPSTSYSYTVTAFDTSGNTSPASAAANATTLALDLSPPTVSMTAPSSGTTLSNTITISAVASDNVAVTSVQFLLNGSPVGSPITSPPYSMSWDTTTVANGNHNLSAIARDAANNSGSSAPVTVTVANAARTVMWRKMTPRPSWPGYDGLIQLYYSETLQRTIVYTVPAGSGSIYASDIYLYNSSNNEFTHVGGTGAMTGQCTLDTPTQPGERHPYWQMAIDSKRNYLWLASGSSAPCAAIGKLSDRADLYYMNLNVNPPVWHQVFPPHPLLRILSALVYDPENDVLFLFGESAAQSHYVYCPTTNTPNPGVLTAKQLAAGCAAPDDWTAITPNNGNVTVSGTGVTLVSGSSFSNVAPGDFIVIRGSFYQVATVVDSTRLILTADAPSVVNEPYYTMPPSVANPGLVYDPVTKKVILFGGSNQPATLYYNQIWTYDVPTRRWTHKGLSTATPPVNTSGGTEANQPAMAYNTATNKILYHQSSSTAGGPADWQYDPVGDTWIRLISTGIGPATGTTMAYDSVNNKLVAWANSPGLGVGSLPEIWIGTLGTVAASSISAPSGTPQAAAINTLFGAQLSAPARDAANNPVSGVR